jgi:hypothetical protein
MVPVKKLIVQVSEPSGRFRQEFVVDWTTVTEAVALTEGGAKTTRQESRRKIGAALMSFLFLKSFPPFQRVTD